MQQAKEAKARRRKIMARLQAGKTTAQVAQELGLAVSTVRFHRIEHEKAVGKKMRRPEAKDDKDMIKQVNDLLDDKIPQKKVAEMLGISEVAVKRFRAIGIYYRGVEDDAEGARLPSAEDLEEAYRGPPRPVYRWGHL